MPSRLRTLEQAVIVRNQILRWFGRAAQEPDAARRRGALTFTIVGGGPTGVEFAGALAELIRGSFRKDYASLDFREVRGSCWSDGHPAAGAPPTLACFRRRSTAPDGVEVRLQAVVQQVACDAVHLRDGTTVLTATLV